ncbi:EAL domain-containing protein [Pseudodesulfovibrio sp. zrk46]|uniref:bifunctional diguanylate cyclase/phosphodiesterase n=1 Tax=Pseudodesulfovibrio sp. zrk46 TaxID=2725288 RepID=UPI001449711A|nr:EAL domain-containing protein [Pseudodesulfovibrio sp. zrk46]QJB55250.1 EAL domain-containing protein [Pseudodesulfovibrio sp. zrk46]
MADWFQKISIKYRLMAAFTVLFILTTGLAAVVIYSTVRDSLEDNILLQLETSTEGIRDTVQVAARVSIRNRLRAIAEKNVEILQGFNEAVQTGEMSEVEARAEARRILLSQTIGETGYIYAMSGKGIVEMHPALGMEGRDLSEHWLGKVQTGQRQGYIEYEWANPGEREERPKALYMMYFEPWDWIVSVSSYRSEFPALVDINDFRSVVDSHIIGKSGYVFIVDAQGDMIIHPWLQGNVTNTKGAKGSNLFQSVLEQGDGQITYWWVDPGYMTPREKLMVFRSVPEMDWFVCSASYLDEVYSPLERLRNLLLLTGAVVVLIILPLGYYLGSDIARPLKALAGSMSQAERGDLSVRADVKCQGEVGELAMRFNQYMSQLEGFNNDLKAEIDERVKAEQQLKLFAMVFHNALEGISITDTNGNMVEVNPSFTSITGYTPEEVLGKNPRVLKSEHHDDDFYRDMWLNLQKEGRWHGEIWNRRKNGETYPEILSISSVRDEDGEICNYVAVFHDISDMKLKDKQLEHQAYHDALTGLPNRTLAQDRLSVAIAHAQREDFKVAVLFLDIDNFKKINDSMGHAVGDILIQQVGERLKNDFRDADTVARLGGDEFLIVVEHVEDEREVIELADRLMAVFAEPFVLVNEEVEVTPSIGVTLYPDDGEDADILIKNADMAMYQSKAKGKNVYFLFTQEMNDRISRRLKLESDMRQAIKDRQFTVYFQPKIHLKTGTVMGMEALVRWAKPDGTIVSPADFIPLAEETGLIVPLGEFVLETSCQAMQLLDGVGCSDITVSVNLSPLQFEQEDLVDTVIANLERNGLPSKKLELEITESTLMTDIETSVEKLNLLSARGISIAIDDFGTGHSSLYYIKNFPINVLKIDQSFVRDMTDDMSDAQIVETIVLMAHNLGVKVVAEGVETRAQLELLEAYGCEMVQGYYYSKPLPLEDVIVYLQSKMAICHEYVD